MSKKPDQTEQIANTVTEFYGDPYGYVMWVFPWGEEGTPLANFPGGPRPWQKLFLLELGKQIRGRGFNGVDPVDPIRMARASGHGIGKSALTAWLIKFILDTRPFAKGVVTANTSNQLQTKTWGELAKWHGMSLTAQFFTYHNTRGNMCIYQNEYPETWRCDALTCKEENSEAFAGLHAATSTPFYIFDEASAIPEKIHEVAQGGLTDGEPMWFQFGNPTRNTGFFRGLFGRLGHRWDTAHIDSRDVEGTNKELFAQWAIDYGEDSDFFRVRVTGQFPRSSVKQLIPVDIVLAAMKKKIAVRDHDYAPRVIGIDCAWFGGDRSTIWFRQGLFSERLWEGREIDNVTLAGIAGEYIKERSADAVFVDAGWGAGVIDILRSQGFSPIPIFFNAKPISPKYMNKRSEMWGLMKDWLASGSVIPEDQQIHDDLIGPEYSMTVAGKIQLEKKESMHKRGLDSPDDGDALALTFAAPVIRLTEYEQMKNAEGQSMCKTEYDVLEDAFAS